ncbi:hypothetical protein ACWEOE_08160 [Amycolatopsis sp. NPDC004368]
MKADRLAELFVVVVGFALPPAIGAGVVVQFAGPSHVEAARVVRCDEVRDPANPPTRYALRFTTAAGEAVDVLSTDPELDTEVGTAVELTRSDRSGAVRAVRHAGETTIVRTSALIGPVWGGVVGVVVLAYAVWLMVRGGKRALPLSLGVGLVSAVAGGAAGATWF